MAEPGDCLDAGEQRLLMMIAAGQSAAEAADDLGVSILAVGRCLASIRARLGVSSTAEALDLVLGRRPS